MERNKKRGVAAVAAAKAAAKKMTKVAAAVAAIVITVYILQRYWAHRQSQEYFVQQEEAVCRPMLSWFTREDQRKEYWPAIQDLQPGDILLTLSTHSLGWRHGHAALVIDQDTTLECAVLGTDSGYGKPESWRRYSGYCVLRVKNASEEQRQQVAEYAADTLYGVPYHLTAGFLGPKAPEPDAAYFGLQCIYLVWYAWNHFGYDIDGDGGRLVTAADLLQSDLLQVVEMQGMKTDQALSK